jgi:hypothetical protein
MRKKMGGRLAGHTYEPEEDHLPQCLVSAWEEQQCQLPARQLASSKTAQQRWQQRGRSSISRRSAWWVGERASPDRAFVM